MSHTPGPWYHTQNYGQVGQVEDAHGNVVAQAQMMRPLDIEVRNANARLIAAAPELLEVLNAIVEEADKAGGGMMRAVQVGCHAPTPPGGNKRTVSRYEIDRARQVIAKALG